MKKTSSVAGAGGRVSAAALRLNGREEGNRVLSISSPAGKEHNLRASALFRAEAYRPV